MERVLQAEGKRRALRDEIPLRAEQVDLEGFPVLAGPLVFDDGQRPRVTDRFSFLFVRPDESHEKEGQEEEERKRDGSPL